MTEATDRPPEPAHAAAGGEEPKPYSSVSPLAIAGFVFAVGYAVIIGVGALIAVFYRTPWVLPAWSLVFPLAAIVVCWAARSGIANSEGTLTGMKLTTWGLYLSFGFGLVYTAYYAACYLSVSQMATSFADEWLEDLKADQVDKAYLLTLPPPRPNADANLRTRLELEYDRGPQGLGKFTEFRQSQMVREFEQGDAAQVQFLGVNSWGYEAAGYKVELSYRVATAAMITDLQLLLIGVENADDANGRQWFVKDYRPTKVTLTPEGTRRSALDIQAHQFVQKWVENVAGWNWAEAYLGTLPPAERERQGKQRGGDFKAGLEKFRQGNLVRADPATFWAAEKDRTKVTDAVRGLFGHGEPNADKLKVVNVPPTYKRDADQVHVGFDFTLPLPPDLMVQGRLLVAANAAIEEPAVDDWHVEALDLYSAKASAAPPGRPPGDMPANPDVKAPLQP